MGRSSLFFYCAAGLVPTGHGDFDDVIMPVFCPTRQTKFVKSASSSGVPTSR
jgi:hypothetical protein